MREREFWSYSVADDEGDEPEAELRDKVGRLRGTDGDIAVGDGGRYREQDQEPLFL